MRTSKGTVRNIAFEPRQLTGPHELRALAHPVRLSLLEALAEHGPLTATAAAPYVGESPSSCSWHLRQLAKFGYVEEAEEASGRRRPWRLTSPAWQRSAGPNQFVLHVTPEELDALQQEVIAVLTRFHERVGNPASRPEGARTVEALLLTYLRDDA